MPVQDTYSRHACDHHCHVYRCVPSLSWHVFITVMCVQVCAHHYRPPAACQPMLHAAHAGGFGAVGLLLRAV